MNKLACYSLLFGLFASISSAAFAADSVPAGSAAAPAASSSAQSNEAVAVGSINLNTADALTLEQQLVGVGPVKARSIIEYREANGPFVSVDELLEVKGIGAATLEKNRGKLSVN